MWKRIALFIPQILVSTIFSIERIKGAGNGAEKAAAVQELVQNSVLALDGIVGRSVMVDPRVQVAFKAANDAIVALQNIVALVETSATPAPPTQ